MGGGGGVGRGVGGWVGGGRREFLVGGVLLARDADLKSLVVLFAEVSFFRSFEGVGRLNVIRDGCQKGEDSVGGQYRSVVQHSIPLFTRIHCKT